MGKCPEGVQVRDERPLGILWGRQGRKRSRKARRRTMICRITGLKEEKRIKSYREGPRKGL